MLAHSVSTAFVPLLLPPKAPSIAHHPSVNRRERWAVIKGASTPASATKQQGPSRPAASRRRPSSSEQIRQAATSDELLGVCHRYRGSLRPFTCSVALLQLSKVARGAEQLRTMREDSRFQQLVEETLAGIDKMEPRSLATCLWALTRLGADVPRESLDRFSAAILAYAATPGAFEEADMGFLWHAVAEGGIRHDAAVRALMRMTKESFVRVTPRTLAAMIKAISRGQWRDDEMLELSTSRLLRDLAGRPDTVPNSLVATALPALGDLGHHPPSLLPLTAQYLMSASPHADLATKWRRGSIAPFMRGLCQHLAAVYPDGSNPPQTLIDLATHWSRSLLPLLDGTPSSLLDAITMVMVRLTYGGPFRCHYLDEETHFGRAAVEGFFVALKSAWLARIETAEGRKDIESAECSNAIAFLKARGEHEAADELAIMHSGDRMGQAAFSRTLSRDIETLSWDDLLSRCCSFRLDDHRAGIPFLDATNLALAIAGISVTAVDMERRRDLFTDHRFLALVARAVDKMRTADLMLQANAVSSLAKLGWWEGVAEGDLGLEWRSYETLVCNALAAAEREAGEGRVDWQAVATLVWAVGHVGVATDGIRQRLSSLLSRCSPDGDALREIGAIATMLFGLGSLQWTAGDNFTRLVQHYVVRVNGRRPEKTSQGLANVVWAMGKLKWRDDKTLKALEPIVIHHLNHTQPEGMSQILWAMGRLKWSSSRLLDAVATAICSREDSLAAASIRDADLMLLTMASLGWRDERLLSRVERCVREEASEATPEECGSLIWAAGELQWDSPPLLTKLTDTLQRHISVCGGGATSLSPKTIYLTLHGLRMLQHSDHLLVGQMVALVPSLLQSMTAESEMDPAIERLLNELSQLPPIDASLDSLMLDSVAAYVSGHISHADEGTLRAAVRLFAARGDVMELIRSITEAATTAQYDDAAKRKAARRALLVYHRTGMAPDDPRTLSWLLDASLQELHEEDTSSLVSLLSTHRSIGGLGNRRMEPLLTELGGRLNEGNMTLHEVTGLLDGLVDRYPSFVEDHRDAIAKQVTAAVERSRPSHSVPDPREPSKRLADLWRLARITPRVFDGVPEAVVVALASANVEGVQWERKRRVHLLLTLCKLLRDQQMKKKTERLLVKAIEERIADVVLPAKDTSSLEADETAALGLALAYMHQHQHGKRLADAYPAFYTSLMDTILTVLLYHRTALDPSSIASLIFAVVHLPGVLPQSAVDMVISRALREEPSARVAAILCRYVAIGGAAASWRPVNMMVDRLAADHDAGEVRRALRVFERAELGRADAQRLVDVILERGLSRHYGPPDVVMAVLDIAVEVARRADVAEGVRERVEQYLAGPLTDTKSLSRMDMRALRRLIGLMAFAEDGKRMTAEADLTTWRAICERYISLLASADLPATLLTFEHLANARVHHPALMEALATAIEYRGSLDTISPALVCRCASALTLCAPTDGLRRCAALIADTADRRQLDLDLVVASIIGRALAVCGVFEPAGLFKRIFSHAAVLTADKAMDEATQIVASRLQQARLAWEVECGSLPTSPTEPQPPPATRPQASSWVDQCADDLQDTDAAIDEQGSEWSSDGGEDNKWVVPGAVGGGGVRALARWQRALTVVGEEVATKSSRLHTLVSDQLDALGVLHENEAVTKEGVSIDVRITLRGHEKVAIEVDGPKHFVRDVTTGAFIAHATAVHKRRTLASRGWKVISLDFLSIDQRGISYVQDELTRAGVLASAAGCDDDDPIDLLKKLRVRNNKGRGLGIAWSEKDRCFRVRLQHGGRRHDLGKFAARRGGVGVALDKALAARNGLAAQLGLPLVEGV
ncbi:unnamed protein product [Vitrella brassicaformis CCMP3155]|uniref:RAP domain-containing protein n=1 Tax=Vitrella brassicaformis (strain CCMP3155) TaxID=1169540 RepID=A0A0G4FB35_VITBC|nr:unnamed protein product [Vitrella brassicaformis CCMP3155]|eukprot:CEM09858.1 unnamed protein product [Vitrella brassicaformis CCMP3155]